MRIANPPTSLPGALERIKELEAQVRELEVALKYDLLPAWVIQDVLDENKDMRLKLREIGG